MDAGGTIPRKESVEPSQERRPRATHGAVAEDVRQIFAPAKSAFPPSMAVVCRGRMDAQERRLRITAEAKPEDIERDLNVWVACMNVGGTIPRKESVESSQEQRPRATLEQLPSNLHEVLQVFAR